MLGLKLCPVASTKKNIKCILGNQVSLYLICDIIVITDGLCHSSNKAYVKIDIIIEILPISWTGGAQKNQNTDACVFESNIIIIL